MSSLVNFFNGMNISDTGATVPSQARTASATIKPQRRFAISVPTTRSSSRTSKPIGSKRKLESCVICLQNCTSTSSAKPDGCDHAVCDTCLRAYYQSALTDTRYHSFEHIQCANPDCEALFVSEKVIRNIFTAKQRDDWWTTATMKTFIENKVECPFGDCKAIFDADVKLTKKCTFAECYECRRGVCTACQSSWHPGVIKILDDEEELKETLREAKEKSWTRCPKCQHLVERKNGCNTMLCKCGTEFCYRCGGYSSKHNCANNCHLLLPDQVEALRSRMFVTTTNMTLTKMRKVR
ncbi:hypothetical protein V8B55DRAFT_1326639 [Mucor lusitanicus]|uniref:RBR-type E3 ubiquitin transferase n=2 Tax=Mucor circinelloides f. lusitanicus TaxID=29924 RepID=A0A168PFQ4_MUCCL|nr:hypothetical protein FB192DRAFT_1457801 [Mucor lusitanicus]OAD07673.1 hypothetical protein MUCCIDRAFT_104612 [Mucor lusitanicus CBS 277.49]